MYKRQRELSVQFQSPGTSTEYQVALKTSGQGLWGTTASELGKVLLASGWSAGVWVAAAFESGAKSEVRWNNFEPPYAENLHQLLAKQPQPFAVTTTQRLDWICAAFSELEESGALAGRDASPSSGGVPWKNLFSSLDDVAPHCPDVVARARLATCAAAYGAVPTQQAWTCLLYTSPSPRD